MEWLNYHHLFYFWKVVHAGGITKACAELRLAPPTVSAQIHSLEAQLGEKLLNRAGRSLVPTEMGRTVFRYAEDIFGLGLELMDTVKRRPTGKPLRVLIGVDEVLPKEAAHALIAPALRLPGSVRILCREAGPERLVAELALWEPGRAVGRGVSRAPPRPDARDAASPAPGSRGGSRCPGPPLGRAHVAGAGMPRRARPSAGAAGATPGAHGALRARERDGAMGGTGQC